jgi:acetolactate synthase-1/2/3 large subunit
VGAPGTIAGIGRGTNEVLRTYPEGHAAKQQDLTGGWVDPCPNYSGTAATSGAHVEKATDPRRVAPAIRRAIEAMRRDGVAAALGVRPSPRAQAVHGTRAPQRLT